MQPFKDGQRVYLRRDPSQFGEIGTTSPTGAVFDLEERIQPVFWEHRHAGEIVSAEDIADLMGEQEYHENRRAFFHVMRHPSMRVLRLALRHLRDDAGKDWREEISSAEITPSEYFSDYSWWQFITDGYAIATCRAKSPNLDYEDFIFIRDSDIFCICD